MAGAGNGGRPVAMEKAINSSRPTEVERDGYSKSYQFWGDHIPGKHLVASMSCWQHCLIFKKVSWSNI